MRPFRLTEQQRNLICKRLPRGFTLLRPEDAPKRIKKEPKVYLPPPPMPQPVPPPVQIPSVPVPSVPPPEEASPRLQIAQPPAFDDLFNFSEPQLQVISASEHFENRVASDIPITQTYSVRVDDTLMNPVPLVQAPSSITVSSQVSYAPPPLFRESSSVSSEIIRATPALSQKPSQVYNLDSTKHKSTERLRTIVGRFKKHRKFPQLTNALSKMGQVAALSRIEEEIKRNCHTLDSFRDKVVDLLSTMKQQQPLAELADQFLMFLNQLVLIGRQEQFEGNLQEIQKSIDRVTRDLTEIKEQGQWYAKKKKRNDRPIDQREVIYICDLIRQLPKAYLVGVWEIVNERPFRENKDFKVTEIDFSQLKSRKIREVEFYVKRKLQNIRKSREQKRDKKLKRDRLLAGFDLKEENKGKQQDKQAAPDTIGPTPMEIQQPIPNQMENRGEEAEAPNNEITLNFLEPEEPNPPEYHPTDADGNQAAEQEPSQLDANDPLGNGVMEARDVVANEPSYLMDGNSSDSSLVTDDEDSVD